ncbi:MAG: hypothetical protein KKC51_01055 [Verrucomicrobia bacterium]|nr:hypothetical protein [Verrucomicrobiota bacterium]
MKLKIFGWLYVACLLPVMLFLVACDDGGGGGTQVVVVTNIVDGQVVVVTNTVTPPEPQNLYNSTLSVPDGGANITTDAVTAPDDGTITAVADWSGGGALHVRLLRNGVAQTGAIDESPITMTAGTDDGINWVVRLDNDSSPGAKNVHVTIGYLPE